MAAKTTSHPATRSSKELIPLELAGMNYMVRPPKGYVGMMIVSRFQEFGDSGDGKDGGQFDAKGFMETFDMLINAVFTKADAKKIRARLIDGDDLLDISDLSEAFPKLVAEASGNPTT